MACCSCFKQGDRLRLPEARPAVPWPGACPAVLLQHSLYPSCSLALALRPWVSLRALVVFLVAAPFPVCTARARPSVSRPLKLAPSAPSVLGNNPPPQAHTRCLPFSRAVRGRRKTGPCNNRTTENQIFSKTVTRPHTRVWRVARGRPKPRHPPRRAPET